MTPGSEQGIGWECVSGAGGGGGDALLSHRHRKGTLQLHPDNALKARSRVKDNLDKWEIH